MKYFIDCEYNGFGGELLTLAIAGEDGRDLSLSRPFKEINAMDLDPWVETHVLPRIDAAPFQEMELTSFGPAIARYLRPDVRPLIVADWPEDIKHFCDALLTKPGEMAQLPILHFELIHKHAYSAKLKGAVPHNALWDARTLRAGYLAGMQAVAS